MRPAPGANYGSYSNPAMDQLIKTAQTPSGGLAAFDHFATYAAQQLPLIYTPEPYDVQAVQAKLHGVGFSPLGTSLPEYWYFTK